MTQLSANSSSLFLGLEKERQVILKLCNQSHKEGCKLASPSLGGHLDSVAVALTSAAIQRRAEHSQRKQRWRSLEHLSLQCCRTPSQKRGKHKLTCTSSPWQHKFRPWLLHYLLILFSERCLAHVVLIYTVPLQGLDSTLSLCGAARISLELPFEPATPGPFNQPPGSFLTAAIVSPSVGCPPSVLGPECIPVVTLCDRSPCPLIKVSRLNSTVFLKPICLEQWSDQVLAQPQAAFSQLTQGQLCHPTDRGVGMRGWEAPSSEGHWDREEKPNRARRNSGQSWGVDQLVEWVMRVDWLRAASMAKEVQFSYEAKHWPSTELQHTCGYLRAPLFLPSPNYTVLYC